MIGPPELKGVDTGQLVEALLHRLTTLLAVEGDPDKGLMLGAAVQALAQLPTTRCERCTKRCALDFLHVTELRRNPKTGAKSELSYTVCPSCYKEANP